MADHVPPPDDALLPGPLKDFIFDLHDTSRRSHLPTEQTTLYHTTFPTLTSKYFATTPWPSPRSVSTECGGDKLFLALYTELTARHLHTVSRPSVRDRIAGWVVYRNLFDMLLEHVESVAAGVAAGSTAQDNDDDAGLYLLPEWSFDVLHEFVYQFQGFCQFRTATFAAAARTSYSSSESDGADGGGGGGGGGSKKTPSPHVMESLRVLSDHRDAWAVESVLDYLHRFVRAGCGAPPSASATTNSASPASAATRLSEVIARAGLAYRHLGLFASVALSRLECLLGDYTASLKALGPVFDVTAPLIVPPIPPGGGDDPTGGSGGGVGVGGGVGGSGALTPLDFVNSVTPARISLSYHASISYLMLRRYRDATSTLGTIATFMQRGFKTGQLRRDPHSDQYGRQYDRILALLAILGHVCPTSDIVEEGVMRVVRDRHNGQLNKIDSGEEGYEDLFLFACPKFISANVPDYSRILAPSVEGGAATTTTTNATNAIPTGQDAYRLQVRQFTTEMEIQSTLRKLRSYMKLYTSIDVAKLAAFNDVREEELVQILLTCKHKTRQVQRCDGVSLSTTTTGGGGGGGTSVVDANGDANGDDEGPLGGKLGSSALDVHFYVNSDMVHVDEAERQRRFENYFLGQIEQNSEIWRDAEKVDTVV
mmetsp:Transcript_3968/g.7799  ORF Transcript_3968/g.7799 Transcript_3968/m.7799 type:complete len:653 (+) Transcript_3968:140-2098(+)